MRRLGLWKEKRGSIHTEDGQLIIIFVSLLSLCSNESFLIHLFFLLHVVPCSVRWPTRANHNGKSETTVGICGPCRQEVTRRRRRRRTRSSRSTSTEENWSEGFSWCHFNSWPEHKTWGRSENITKPLGSAGRAASHVSSLQQTWVRVLCCVSLSLILFPVRSSADLPIMSYKCPKNLISGQLVLQVFNSKPRPFWFTLLCFLEFAILFWLAVVFGPVGPP